MEKEFEALEYFTDTYKEFLKGKDTHCQITLTRNQATEFVEEHKKVEQALTNRQELEKFTRLLVVKSFNFDRFRYVLRHWDTVEEQFGVYNYGIGNVYKYTKEEFTFIKEMIVKYGK